MLMRSFVTAAFVVSLTAFAQTPSEPRVIVVPYPSDVQPDAGSAAPSQLGQQTSPTPPTNTEPAARPPPPPPPPTDVPTQPVAPAPAPTTLDAPPPPPSQPGLGKNEIPSKPPSAMLDGHPREGAFLSGPGSLPFILHHTLLGLTMGVATQLVPKLLSPDEGTRSCNDSIANSACAQGARLAYLGFGLVGAAVGFGSSAAWQFFNWMSDRSAYFGIANSVFGGMFGAGFMNLLMPDATATSWGAWIGALAGAWISTVVGGGDLPMNHGWLMASGGYWSAVFVGLVLGIVASTNKNITNVRGGIDAILMAPAVGAGAMALALLKFNPSSAQVLRADLFGTAAGVAVFLISAAVLSFNFAHPVPYILSGVAAAGAITTVSLLWAEGAEARPSADSPSTKSTSPGKP